MSKKTSAGLLEHIRRLAGRDASDGELLRHFIACRDEDAFSLLVQRHGAMVLGVCRRVLCNVHDSDDAFQATFLILVRKAAALDEHRALGNWLYTVAYRVALRARADAVRRCRHEHQAVRVPPPADDSNDELRQVLDAELARIPEKYRAPIVLCYLEGKTNDEAARLLGWSKGTVSGRLARARALLQKRLARRQLGFAVAAFTALAVENELSAALTQQAVKNAVLFTSGKTIAAPVAALVEGGTRAMASWTRAKVVTFLVLTLTVFGLGSQVLLPRTAADTPEQVADPASKPRIEAAVAAIPGEALYLNLDAAGKLRVPGRDRPLDTLAEIEAYLRGFQEGKGWWAADAKPEMIVIVRGCEGTPEARLKEVAQLCKGLGFQRVRLRTVDHAPSGSPKTPKTSPGMPPLSKGDPSPDVKKEVKKPPQTLFYETESKQRVVRERIQQWLGALDAYSQRLARSKFAGERKRADQLHQVLIAARVAFPPEPAGWGRSANPFQLTPQAETSQLDDMNQKLSQAEEAARVLRSARKKLAGESEDPFQDAIVVKLAKSLDDLIRAQEEVANSFRRARDAEEDRLLEGLKSP